MPAENVLDFRFSDLVAGYVIDFRPDEGRLRLRTGDGRHLRLQCAPLMYAERLRNLGEEPVAVTGQLAEVLRAGQFVFAYGVVTPAGGTFTFEAHRITVCGTDGGFRFDEPDWWPRQLRDLARFYRRAQFGTEGVDMRDYRTMLRLGGDKSDHHIQETDTLSRLVYGMASAFMLTGDEQFLEVAEAGTQYLREHMRFVDRDHDVVYWYHGIDVRDGVESKLFASEFGDDYAAIPAYEQIYALAGPTQTYRITGDPRILADIEATMRLFDRFFRDRELGGWYSHVDPIDLRPDAPSLGPNRSRKNWNSIGDFTPAFLLNLFLATGETCYADMLVHSADLITTKFPDLDSPFVQERFHREWTPDRAWGWQQDGAVIGHNLKIAWNLMRVDAIAPRPAYREFAERIGRTMPAVGADAQRGGWYDVVDRRATPETGGHRFVWHDRKAWWQQEQAILAYLILAGRTGDEQFLRQARESAAFYNAAFLDHDEGGVYFNVLASGVPYLLGTERLKGSHAMSMYHSAELCLLATVYQRLLIHDEPLELWFRPRADGFAGRLLRVAPDALPPGRVRLEGVELDGVPYRDFDPDRLLVRLPSSAADLTVRARIVPVR